MKAYSRNQKSIIALAVAVILFALIKFLLLPAFEKISDQKTNIKFKEKTLEKYAKAIKQQEKLNIRLKKTKKRKQKNNQMFPSGRNSITCRCRPSKNNRRDR